VRAQVQFHRVATAPMRRHPAVALPMAGLLLLAACGGAAAPSTASNPPIESASPTTAATATASPDPTIAPTPTADANTGLADCFSGDMPNLDSGWKFIKGGDKDGDATFGVAYPEDWDDLSGDGAFTTATLLDTATFAELGLANDATIESDFVRAPEGLPNLSVFRFGAVGSSSAEIQEREVARYGALDDIERILDTSVEGCLGGTRAAGLALEFRSSDGKTYYQQNLFAVRNGELYVVQWLDRLDPDTDLLGQILTTWGWIGFGEPTATEVPSGSGGIAGASMASKVDDTLAQPDPSTFVTSFPTDAPTIYVVYQTEEGAAGTVHLTWLIEGEAVFEASLDVTATTPWAWGGITPPSGGFKPGNYEVKLELNGNVATVPFTVEAAS
jgi:hypothetical protein